MTDVNISERAMAYVDEIRWRLEVMQYRSRYNVDTGEYKRLPTRIRRFSNGIPVDIVSYVLEILNKKCTYTGMAFNGEELEGTYRSTGSQCKKDDSLKSGSDPTYTIVQDLLLVGEPDTYRVGDSSACSGVTESEYHWDEASILECPDGGQGVTYRIRDVQRDSNTDLFSFCVQKSVAVTQHMPETTTECDDDSTVTTELWDNVYGEPGDWRWDEVKHDGSEVPIPAPCSSGQGNLIEVTYDENDDCTFKVKVVRTMSKISEEAEYMRMRDQFEIQTMDLVKHSHTKLSKDGVEFGDGKVTKYESVENPDETWNNKVTVKTERTVKESTVQRTVNPRYTLVSWTDTNVADAASGLPAGYEFGTFKYTKTPGGRFVNEFAGYVPNLERYGYSCEDTTYLHTHMTEESVLGTEFPSEGDHVVEAHDGIVSSTVYQKDETTGIVSKRLQVKEEHPVESAKRTVTNGLFGRTVEYTNRSWDSYFPEPEVGSNVFATAEYLITDGRRYDASYRTFERAPAGRVAAQACSKTAFAHEDSSDVSADSVGACVDDAGHGIHRKTSFTVDPQTGVIRKQETVHTEIPFDYASVSKTKSPRSTTVKYIHRNTSQTAAELPSVPMDPGQSENRSTNDGKSVDVERTEVVPNEGTVLRDQCQVNSDSHTHQTETVLAKDADVKAGTSAGKGVSRQTEVSIDDNGVATSRDTVITEYEHEFGTRTHEDAMQAYQVIAHTSTDKNIGDPKWPSGAGFSMDEGGSDIGAANVISEAQRPFADTHTTTRIISGLNYRASAAQMSEAITAEKLVTGGGFQRGVQVVTDAELTKGGKFTTKEYLYRAKPHKWLDDISSDTYHSYVWNFRNLTQDQVNDLVADVVKKSAEVNIDNRNVHPFIRRSLNDYGLFDGSTGFEESHSRQTWFNSTSKESEIEEVPYTETHRWQEKSIHVRPVTDLNPLSTRYRSDTPATFLVQVTWTSYASGYGIGSGSLKAAVNGKRFYASPSISYDPKSQMFRLTYAYAQKTTLQLLAGNNVPVAGSGGILLAGNNVLDESL